MINSFGELKKHPDVHVVTEKNGIVDSILSVCDGTQFKIEQSLN